MSISDKTRKIIWGRSGAKCAICRLELVATATSTDDESIVGDECHIISGASQGPRHSPDFPEDQIDDADNLLVLCRVDHKRVDDQPGEYTVERLKRIKIEHEAWVAASLKAPTRLRVRSLPGKKVDFLPRLQTGTTLMEIVGGACAFSFTHDEFQTRDEMQLVSAFVQNVKDTAEIWNDLEPADRIEATFNIGYELTELGAAGFFVFGAREEQRLEGGIGGPMPWSLAIVRVVCATSAEIIKLDLDETDVADSAAAGGSG
jgi:hypothetical protein